MEKVPAFVSSQCRFSRLFDTFRAESCGLCRLCRLVIKAERFLRSKGWNLDVLQSISTFCPRLILNPRFTEAWNEPYRPRSGSPWKSRWPALKAFSVAWEIGPGFDHMFIWAWRVQIRWGSVGFVCVCFCFCLSHVSLTMGAMGLSGRLQTPV